MNPILKNIIATLITIMISYFSLSQPNQSILETTIKNLRQSRVDTIIKFTPFQGDASMVDKGKFQILYSSYLFWKRDNKFFISKVSYCLDNYGERSFDTVFNPISLPDTELYEITVQNRYRLKSETLRPGKIRFQDGSKDTVYEIRSSHAGITGISIFIGSSEISNYYSLNHIDDGTIRNIDGSIRTKRQSINYEYNSATLIFKLVNRFASLIQILEGKNSFDK